MWCTNLFRVRGKRSKTFNPNSIWCTNLFRVRGKSVETLNPNKILCTNMFELRGKNPKTLDSNKIRCTNLFSVRGKPFKIPYPNNIWCTNLFRVRGKSKTRRTCFFEWFRLPYFYQRSDGDGQCFFFPRTDSHRRETAREPIQSSSPTMSSPSRP